jgi:hypothetical protein
MVEDRWGKWGNYEASGSFSCVRQIAERRAGRPELCAGVETVSDNELGAARANIRQKRDGFVSGPAAIRARRGARSHQSGTGNRRRSGAAPSSGGSTMLTLLTGLSEAKDGTRERTGEASSSNETTSGDQA